MSKLSTYKQLANSIIESIHNDTYQVGDPLPSLRKFTQLQQVSMTTALNCYRYLEQQGYAIAEPKRGYFITQPTLKAHSHTFPYFKALPAHINNTQNHSVIPRQSLATAELDNQLIDRVRIQKCWQQAVKDSSLIFGYADIQGEPRLRSALSTHFLKQGFTVSDEELVISNGCLDAVCLALEVVSKPGDIILVSSPCYLGLLDMLRTLNRKIIEVPSTQAGLDLVQLESALHEHPIAACILTANHQNPTGHSLSLAQKRTIAALAKQYQTPIIEDDVFRELSHKSTIPLPIKHFDKDGWVLWCASVSKTLAAGLRLGWCAPGRFYEKYLKQRKVRTLGVNQPIQLALALYIQRGYYQHQLTKTNRLLKDNVNFYLRYLEQHLPKDCVIFQPQGGLVLWLDLALPNTQELCESLDKQGVYLLNGKLFTSTALYHSCIRLNIGLLPSASVITQLDLLVNTVRLLKNSNINHAQNG